MNDTFTLTLQASQLIEIFFLAFLGFALSILITPIYTTLAYRGKWWKKPRSNAVTGEKAKIFAQLHAEKHRRMIPTMAGVIFLVSVLVVTSLFNLEREETWLPLAAFLGAGAIGLIDDLINIRGTGAGVAGLPSKIKFMLTVGVALIGGLYFYLKLDVHSMYVPGLSVPLEVGWLIVPLFVLVVVSTTNAVNFTDGLDGLAGGLAAIAFGNFAIIAFLQERFGVAGFCLTMVGALLSYTWFNVYPARFFMGDSGSYALGTALGVVAMITDTVLLLPIIGAVFVAEAGSSVLQILSKKLRKGKKIFKIAPLHHHFEASGWPETKVTMRFWILGQVSGVIGIMIFVLSNYHV
ncbi:MAG: phospho-N-acetylmuramoyl-pentapeptide-transferase [Candidatus Saccharimonadales bacterium]